MAEGKHTPGPWQVGCEHGLQKLEIANSDYSKAIATVWAKQSVARREDGRQVFVADPEGEANCRLIAAAPDLLAERDRLKEINAELLAALMMTKSWLESEPLWNAVISQPGCETFGKRIEAAISRATVTP